MSSVVYGGTLGLLGDSERLAELYANHIVETRRLAFLLTGSRETADDLAQDAFIRSFGRLVHLRKEGSFRPYLRRTVVNLARMRYRRQAVERRHLSSQKVIRSGPVQDTHDEVLSDALMQLPYRQRAAIVLRFYCDLPDEETATVLGCAPGTVRSLISRGLVGLRTSIQDGDLGG